MEYRTLGRTGLKVSVMGIGAGGSSRLGQRNNINTEAESIDILKRGFDAGINFIDTAEVYGTEGIVGKAIAGRERDSIVISTKKSTGKNQITADDVMKSLDNSLQHLGIDTIDIYHLHGVRPENYEYCRDEIYPILEQARQQGKIRFTGITEAFNTDLDHRMLEMAIQDGLWDVLMVGFSLLNQTARDSVLKPSIEANLGILVMFAVRRALSQAEYLQATIQKLIESSEINPREIAAENPLSFLVDEGHAVSIPDAAYRYCRDEPGTHVILSGTGNPAHLQANIDSLNRPPLSPAVVESLKTMFRNVHSITGE